MAHLRPRVALAAALLSLAAPAAAPAAGPPPTHRCADQPEFRCGTLTVPLDRSGRLAGTLGLRFAVQAGHPRRPLLVALAGGPGQSAVGLAEGFTTTLDPLLRRYRLAVVDQRGTGESGALRCPSVQRLRWLDPFRPAAVGACARAVGPPGRLHDRGHGAGPRRAARSVRQREARAHGRLLRHARRAAVRPDLPGADRPPRAGLDRRPGRPRPVPARHAAQPAARAAHPVRRAGLRGRHDRPGGRPGRGRAAAGATACRGDRRRRAGPAAHRALPHRRGAAVPHDRRRPQPLPAGAAAGGARRRPGRR